MPYIGHNPTQAGSFILLDDFDSGFDGSDVTFTLQVGGVDITPTADNLLIILDGVVQHSPEAYTVSGSTLTFTAAPADGQEFYGMLMGQSASVGEGTVGADELSVSGNGSSNQMLVSDGDGTMTWKGSGLSATSATGDIIYRNSSGELARLAVGSSGQVLTVASGVPAWETDVESYLPLSGGTMTGALNMGSQNINSAATITGTALATGGTTRIDSSGVLNNITGTDSATRNAFDDHFALLAGATFTGAIGLSDGQKIHGDSTTLGYAQFGSSTGALIAYDGGNGKTQFKCLNGNVDVWAGGGSALAIDSGKNATFAGHVTMSNSGDDTELVVAGSATNKASILDLTNPANSVGGSGNNLRFKEGNGGGGAGNSLFTFHHSPNSGFFKFQADGSDVWTVNEGSQNITFAGMAAIGGALDTGSGGTGQLQVIGGQGAENTLLKLNSNSTSKEVRIFFTDGNTWSNSIGCDTDGDFVIWRNGTSATEGVNNLRIDNPTGNATFAGDLQLSSDSTAYKAGASNDLQMFHDGSHSYIQHENTGDLKILSARNNGDIQMIVKDSGGTQRTALQLTGAGNATFGGTITSNSEWGYLQNTGGNANFVIKANAGGNSRLYFGDTDDAGVGFIDYDHGTSMTIGAGGAVGLTLAESDNTATFAGAAKFNGGTTTAGKFGIVSTTTGGDGSSGGHFTNTSSDGYQGRGVYATSEGGFNLGMGIYCGSSGATNNYALYAGGGDVYITNDILIGGDILPLVDNSKDLGSSSKRWANLYVGDMHLKNDRGDWTVIEEEDYLSLKNNKNGKTYKLVMEEV